MWNYKPCYKAGACKESFRRLRRRRALLLGLAPLPLRRLRAAHEGQHAPAYTPRLRPAAAWVRVRVGVRARPSVSVRVRVRARVGVRVSLARVGDHQ